MLSNSSQLKNSGFELLSTTGEVVSLTPNKKTVIYFFAPWCSVCHASINNLQNIYQKNEEINVIAVGLDYMEEDEIMRFVSEHQLTFPVVFGNEKVKQVYKIHAYPSYYVFDENNTVIAKSMGYSTEFGLYLKTL